MAIQAIKAGVNAREVDAVAREHIESQGFKDKFNHSLGHGTGLAVHEEPRMGPVKETSLQSGMLVTVEPGVYLPDWGGVRIENQVVVEEQGCRVLNQLGRTYRIDQLIGK
jgi:Xaa-Pro aminopeptidase